MVETSPSTKQARQAVHQGVGTLAHLPLRIWRTDDETAGKDTLLALPERANGRALARGTSVSRWPRYVRLATALLLVSLTAACGGGSGSASREPSTTSVPATTATSAPTSTTPIKTSLPTPASLLPASLFNQPIPASWPVDPRSSEFVKDFVSDYTSDYGAVGINFGVPLYEADAGTPEVPISITPGCNDFLTNTGDQAPVPSDVLLNGSSDNPLVIYSPSMGKEWEFWQMSATSTGYQACWGGELDMASTDGVFSSPFGLSASGISYMATTITEADVASGAIKHTLAVLLPACDANAMAWPADRTDCAPDPGEPGEGTWFRFSAKAVLPTGLPPLADMVFKAIRKYGMVVVDRGGAVQVSAEEPSDWSRQGHPGAGPFASATWGQPEYTVIAALPWDDLEVVDPPGVTPPTTLHGT